MHIRIILILVIEYKKAFVIVWLGVRICPLADLWGLRGRGGLGVIDGCLNPAVDYRSLADIELDGASLRLLRLLRRRYLDGHEVGLEITPPLESRINALKLFFGRIRFAHWRLPDVLFFVGAATIFIGIQDISDGVILEIELR